MRGWLGTVCWLGIGWLCATPVWGLQLLSGPQRTPASHDPADPMPPPRYPREALAQKHEGTVLVLVRVEKDGQVGDARIDHSSGYLELDRAALDAVRTWHFKPGLIGTLPQVSYARVPVRFVLPANDGAGDAGLDFSLVSRFMARYQYVPQALDAPLAEKALRVYIDQLDPERLFFSADDVAGFLAKRDQLAQMLADKDLSLPQAIATRHAELATQRLEHAIAMLDKGDLGATTARDGTVPGDAPFLTPAKLDQRWREIVKGDRLQLKSAGKHDAQIKALLAARYRDFERHLVVDTGQAPWRFIDAYAMAGGEGSRYYPQQASWFAALTPLGVSISSDANGARIDHVSPLLRNLGIGVGDRLVGLAVNESDTVYLEGWQAAEVKAKLEGVAPDATVRLVLRSRGVAPGGRLRTVTLKASGTLSAEAASLRYVTAPGRAGGRVAVISLPSFYLDTAAKTRGVTDFASAARDVQQLLAQASQSDANGVILDLRGNAGGALSEAADVASLFAGNRTLWRSRNYKGTVEQMHGAHDEASWTGPLAVLIDHASTEGSELVAAALQDNQRALIVGRPSAGAGNLGNAIDLDRFAGDAQPAGNGLLKLTIATMFRASGEGITGHGVVPDIELPLAPAFPHVDGPALMSFDNLPPMPVEPMFDIRGRVPALRRDLAERTAGLPAWNGSRLGGYPDEDDLLRVIAGILFSEKPGLFTGK